MKRDGQKFQGEGQQRRDERMRVGQKRKKQEKRKEEWRRGGEEERKTGKG